jgi:hypothetical protein
MKLAPATAIADGTTSPLAEVWSRALLLPALAVVFIFIVLVGIGMSGVRGSDQYWYVADVESLINGRGIQTNEVYPVSIRGEVAPLPRPFVHNILNIYVVALPALLFGAYGGWIVVNVFSSLLTAFLIFFTIVRLVDSRAVAMTFAVSYLLLPVTVWLTTQPLAEASIAPLVALAVYLYVTASAGYWRWALLMVVAALLVYCRESFVLLLPLIPLAYVVHTAPRRVGTLARAAGLAVFGGALWLLGKHLFEPHISVSYLQVLSSGVSDYSSNSYFRLSSEPPTISAIVAKAIRGLEIQFLRINARYFLFYLPFNLMALAPLVLVLRERAADVGRVAAAGLVFVGLHLITATVVQNQFRYLLVATPPLLVALGVGLGRAEWVRTRRVPAIAMAAVVLIATAPGAALAWRSHTEGVRDRQIRENLAAAFGETLPTEDTMMVALDLTKGFDAQMLGYVLRPRRVLYVSDRYDADDYVALIRNADAKWLLSRRDAPLLDRLAPSALREARTLPAPFADWSLFTIESDPWRR